MITMQASESQNTTDKQPMLKMKKTFTGESGKENEFLSRMAHEFKNPLTKIYSAAQLLQSMEKEDEEQELIDFILNGSKKLMYLMNNFFEYSREVESPKNKLNKTQEDLVPIIKKVVRDLQFFIDNRNHDLSLKIPEKLIVDLDKFKIEQVITNLLNNAIKYTPPNGFIEVEVENNGTHFTLSIKDNGIGVRKEDLKYLFKKYSVICPNYEPDENLFMEGTGLGLYLSKKIVNLHNGKIWAESEGLNEGTTFFVKLPIGK